MQGSLPPCWGIGLARTGTTSFCQALTLLGYQRVGHNPEFAELGGLDGGADNGVTLFYKYLDYKFPGSKFVLTTRPIEAWLKSMEHIFGRHPVRSRAEDIPIMRRMMLYETVSFDPETLRASFERHAADVRRYFAGRPNDLLELNITEGQGWAPLCAFLGVPQPDAPFPNLNARG